MQTIFAWIFLLSGSYQLMLYHIFFEFFLLSYFSQWHPYKFHHVSSQYFPISFCILNFHLGCLKLLCYGTIVFIIIAVTVSLGKPYAISICSIFSLCMESINVGKSTGSSVASRIFARTHSMIRRIVRLQKAVDRFLQKQFWFFLKNFFDFRLDTVEQHDKGYKPLQL